MARGGVTAQTGFVGAAARFWERSYASDYLGLALLLTAYLFIQFFMEPFHRMFSLDDLRISYPHALVERVPVPLLFIDAGAVPLAILVLWSIFGKFDLHKTHVTILGLFLSLILTSFITDVIKNAVGRPRPDLIARCKPDLGTPGHSLVTIDVCTETNHHTLHDGWRSFPSGHSSWAFAGLGYTSLFLCGQLSIFRPGRSSFIHVLLVIAPVLAAALIAISRLEDYRHDVFDVTAGSTLGSVVAWAIYRRYYPGLASRRAGVPYPPPGVEKDGRQGKRTDEEVGPDDFELDDMESTDEERKPALGGARERSGSRV